MQPIDHLQASSIHLKAHNYYYQFSLSKTVWLPPFPGYYGRPTRSAKSFSRTGPIEVSTADVPAPLPDMEHTVLTKEEQKRNMLKNRRGSILLRFPFFSIQCWLPTHDESERPKKCNSMMSLYMWPHAFGNSSGSIS